MLVIVQSRPKNGSKCSYCEERIRSFEPRSYVAEPAGARWKRIPESIACTGCHDDGMHTKNFDIDGVYDSRVLPSPRSVVYEQAATKGALV